MGKPYKMITLEAKREFKLHIFAPNYHHNEYFSFSYKFSTYPVVKAKPRKEYSIFPAPRSAAGHHINTPSNPPPIPVEGWEKPLVLDEPSNVCQVEGPYSIQTTSKPRTRFVHVVQSFVFNLFTHTLISIPLQTPHLSFISPLHRRHPFRRGLSYLGH